MPSPLLSSSGHVIEETDGYVIGLIERSRTLGNPSGRCPTCGKAPVFPYIRYDAGGRIFEGCVDAIHASQLAISGPYREWFYSPSARKVRANTANHLYDLGLLAPRDMEIERVAREAHAAL